MRLFDDIIKDATAQSVHRSTALGNSKGKKRRSFNDFMADESHLLEESQQNGPEPDEPDDIIRPEKRWDLRLDFRKADADRRLIFGWASVSTKDGKHIVDKQGDIIPVEELEKAAYEFVLFSRDQGDMHDEMQVGKLVESVVYTAEKQKALGIDLGQEGWWVGFYVNSDKVWAAIKRGERPEFSIGGAAVPVDLDDLLAA